MSSFYARHPNFIPSKPINIIKDFTVKEYGLKLEIMRLEKQNKKCHEKGLTLEKSEQSFDKNGV